MSEQPVINITNMNTASFPQEIEATITYKLRVNTQDERDYYLNPETGATAVSFLADSADMLMTTDSEELLAVNNCTSEQLQTMLRMTD